MSALVLTSPLLARHGFAHGFATRAGGVSAPPFESLQLGRSVGDDPEAVAENQRRLAAAVGYPPGVLCELSQVHGARVREVRRGEDPTAVRAEEGDALVTREAGLALGVRTADCLPLLLADPETGCVAAIHAGWRGVVAGIVAEGTRALVAASGAPPARLLAAIGPHIRAASFEVGEDVAARIARSAPGAEDVVIAREPRPHVDIAAAVRAQLAMLGVASIDDTGGDTFAEPERFYSHRRDAERSGRHLSVIVSR